MMNERDDAPVDRAPTDPLRLPAVPVLTYLQQLGIEYETYEHEPINTAEEGDRLWFGIDAVHSKNLFLRNQKGDRHYLLIVRHHKRVDLRAAANQIGDGKLSFASPQRLMAHLGVRPGSVSPFGLINDVHQQVRVFLVAELASADRVSFHPNINTMTLVLTRAGFERFLAARGNPVRYLTLESAASSPPV
jgi:Ala-tRNA(Pro) deacylase